MPESRLQRTRQLYPELFNAAPGVVARIRSGDVPFDDEYIYPETPQWVIDEFLRLQSMKGHVQS